MRNSASSRISGPPGRIAPSARAKPTLPARATISAAPGARPAPISRSISAANRSSAGLDSPIASGSATGSPAKSCMSGSSNKVRQFGPTLSQSSTPSPPERGLRQPSRGAKITGGKRDERQRRGADMRIQPIAVVVLASVFALSGCDLAVLDPKGPIADQDLQILVDSLAIMLAIVIPTIIAIVGFAWWFRAGNPRARYRP